MKFCSQCGALVARLIPPGDTGAADINDPKLYFAATETDWLHMPPGSTLSLIELA